MVFKSKPSSKIEFRDRVYHAVQTVPVGWVTTYGDIAAAVGSPRAARQVGFALSQLSSDQAQNVPWHRVINSQGRISLRGDLVRGEMQRSRLEREGIVFNPSGRVALDQVRWHYPDWLETS